jgi:hypothetical protein
MTSAPVDQKRQLKLLGHRLHVPPSAASIISFMACCHARSVVPGLRLMA